MSQRQLALAGDVETNPGPSMQPLSIGALNVRSLTSPTRNAETKLDLISLLCSVNSLDIFGISETWLDNSIPDDKILLPGFLPPFRRDRRRDGGGVAVYVSEAVAAKRCPLIEPSTGEFICIDLALNRNHYLLCFFYRPPSASIDDFIDNLCYIITKAKLY